MALGPYILGFVEGNQAQMERQMTKTRIATHDLGNGWFANQACDDQGIEEMTIRNPDKGVRIDLPNDSVKTLRRIFQSHERG